MCDFVYPMSAAASARTSVQRWLASALSSLGLVLLLVCLGSARAYGDVGVVLNESLDTSVARITGSGHSAVYLSRVCPESPVKLRLCRPGEQGSVVSNYTTLGEDQPFEWNIVPLSVYLYGVEDPQDRPIVGSQKIKRVLEERYREKYLTEYCANARCAKSSKAEWREMVGAALSRSIYIFVVDTTVEQDLELIQKFNSLPNHNHFNAVTRNCADFTRSVINTYFPRATSPDYINDFGMTSPKAIARSFTHYALRHPEARFRVFHFAQSPGTIKRSSECRDGTEQLYHSKKLLVPMVLFADHALPAVAASYALTGRFNPEHEWEEHPTAEIAEISYQIELAKADKDNARAEQLQAVQSRERVQVLGASEEWKEYRRAFDSMVEEAVRKEVIPERGYLNRLLKRVDESGTPFIDGNSALWMKISDRGETSTLGLTAGNISAVGSDSQLAYALLLARTAQVLKSPKHSRESMAEFKNDWAILQSARTRSALPRTKAATLATATRTSATPTPQQ